MTDFIFVNENYIGHMLNTAFNVNRQELKAEQYDLSVHNI